MAEKRFRAAAPKLQSSSKAFHNEPGIDEVVDSSEELAVWFSQYGCAGVLIRPDFYVFGTFTNCGEARLLIDELLHIAPISRVGSAE
jgi:hypothetical protein